MKNRKIIIILAILLLANICATVILGIAVHKLSSEKEASVGTTQYVMYVGLNDKDTDEQIISKEDAKEIIENICFKYVEGYTIQEASGSWVDEENNSIHEQTIVCHFDDADESAVHKIADEVIEKLNQSTVLIEKDKIETDLYEGSE